MFTILTPNWLIIRYLTSPLHSLWSDLSLLLEFEALTISVVCRMHPVLNDRAPTRGLVVAFPCAVEMELLSSHCWIYRFTFVRWIMTRHDITTRNFAVKPCQKIKGENRLLFFGCFLKEALFMFCSLRPPSFCTSGIQMSTKTLIT